MHADSDAMWLGGGDQFMVTARLPFDPTKQVTVSRARALQRYEGRSRAVAYAGEQTAQTISAGGTILTDDERNASLARMEELAQSSEPVHLYRDPDGKRVYGMLSAINLTRNTDIWWGFDFTLEETSK